MFGHGGPSAAPVSRNYPEMRERLRLLLNKKKRTHKSNQQQQQQKAQNPDAGAARPSLVKQQQQPPQQRVQPVKQQNGVPVSSKPTPAAPLPARTQSVRQVKIKIYSIDDR